MFPLLLQRVWIMLGVNSVYPNTNIEQVKGIPWHTGHEINMRSTRSVAHPARHQATETVASASRTPGCTVTFCTWQGWMVMTCIAVGLHDDIEPRWCRWHGWLKETLHMHINDLFKTKYSSIYCNWTFKYPVKRKNFSRSFELIDFKASVPEMRIWSILLIISDLKWCIHLSRSLFLYFNYLVSVTAGGPKSPRGHI